MYYQLRFCCFAGGEGHSIFYTGFLDSASANGTDHPPVGGSVGSPTSPNGSTTLPAKYVLLPAVPLFLGFGTDVVLDYPRRSSWFRWIR